MKHFLITASCCLVLSMLQAQELFVATEPASNMAKGSAGLRLGNYLMKEKYENGYNYHLIPELMVGVSKKLMLHAEAFVSNRNKNSLEVEGGSLYLKYRFLSKDDIQKHFRMAAYGRASINNSDIHQEEIETNGHNSGYELGLIATQLLHKLALSASASYEKALDNGTQNKYPYIGRSAAFNYTLSAGRLMLPKAYTDYKQTNVNFMFEVLGQINAGSGRSYIDVVPSIQFIFNSRSRIDVGYRQQLLSSLTRTAPNGFIVRFEHNFFNIF